MNRSASVSVLQTHGAARAWIDIYTRAVVFLRRGRGGGGGLLVDSFRVGSGGSASFESVDPSLASIY